MRILIVEDHPLYLQALRDEIARAISHSSILSATSVAGALLLLSETPVDLVVLDYSLPDASGVAALRRVMSAASGTPLVMISGLADGRAAWECLKAGARGFIPKTLDGRLVGLAVALVASGGTFIPAEIVAGLTVQPADAAPRANDDQADSDPAFSARETTMLRMLVTGASNKEIARELGLEEVTVKFYFTRLFRRMGVRNRSQAAVEAVRSGLIDARARPPVA